MRHFELADEPFECARFFERVQIFPLDILDQRHGDGCFISYATNERGNLMQTGQLRSAPAPLSGDDFVAAWLLGAGGVVERPHDDGLYQTLRLNRVGELLQTLLTHIDARLIFATL